MTRCTTCRYALIRGSCPMCSGRAAGVRMAIPIELPPLLPPEIRAIRVTREQFITPQHYEAWRNGRPLLRHLERRKKFTQEERAMFWKHRPYQCALCPSTSLLTLDHIVPQIFGGSSKDINLRGLCNPCNRAVFAVFRPVLFAVRGAA